MLMKSKKLLFAMFAFGTMSQAFAVPPNTHLGVPVNDLVVAHSYTTPSAMKPLEWGPLDIEIPEGKVLVVTDVAWRVGNMEIKRYRGECFQFIVRNLNAKAVPYGLSGIIFESSQSCLHTHTIFNENKFLVAGTHDALTTGFVIRKEDKLEISVDQLTGFAWTSGKLEGISSLGLSGEAVFHGYFIADQ